VLLVKDLLAVMVQVAHLLVFPVQVVVVQVLLPQASRPQRVRLAVLVLHH
jgi:hypothetical protein